MEEWSKKQQKRGTAKEDPPRVRTPNPHIPPPIVPKLKIPNQSRESCNICLFPIDQRTTEPK